MLGIILGRAKELGVTLVELEVFASNEKAIHVYRKLGFKAVGRIPRRIMRNGKFIDIIVMCAQL
jgi:RimJ/RimL family protein N-acetyltransferase